MPILEHLPGLNTRRIILASQSPRRSQLLTQIGLKGFTIRVPTFEEDLPKERYRRRAAHYAVETARHKALEVARMEQSEIIAAAAAAVTGDGVKGASATASVRGQLSSASARGLLRMPDLVVSADTVVESPLGEILEKPESGPDAHAAMLRSLSGAAHRVHTGVALVLPSPGREAAARLAREMAATPAPTLEEEEPEPAPGSTGPCLKHTVLTPEGWLVRTFAVTTRVRFAPLSDEAIRAYVASGEGDGKAGGYGIQNSASSFVSELVGDYFSVVGFPLHAFSVELANLIEGRLLELGGEGEERGDVAAVARAGVAT